MKQREMFDEQLNGLCQDIAAMSEMTISAILRSVEALRTKDAEAAQRIIAEDAAIDDAQRRIEEKGLALIATQQPVAGDLREIIAIINISAELERMGDYAEGIAKIVLLHGDKPLVKPLVDIPRMAELNVQNIRDALQAFRERDVERARLIWNKDDEIDTLYNQVFRELITYMIEDPRTITRSTYLIWAAHNLERIGDRVTNICERIVYLVTGRLERMKA
ncbi:MAG: phosphate signaling complex protein PhoU [Candidatus Sumerlaeia bacterium]